MTVAGATPIRSIPFAIPIARNRSVYAAASSRLNGCWLANGTMPKRRHHSGICKQPNCSLLFEVENYG
jgi:hypothetical protein